MQDTTIDHAGAVNPAQSASTQEGSAPSPSFNVFRFRKMDENSPDFYDPVTDILNILPEAIQNSMHTMESIMPDDSEEFSIACDMAYNIHQLFQIRLIEQKDDIDEVLKEFMEVFHQYSVSIRAMFTELLFTNLMVMWSVSQRRSSALKPKKILESKETMEIGSILTYLPEALQQGVKMAVRKQYTEAVSMLKEEASEEKIGFVDEANNVILDDAKGFVASRVPVKDGPKTWSTIAKILNKHEPKTITEAAMQETYPDYITRHNNE